jgi:predicted DNA-binding antitoxin AbrB/MazE fold protein
MMTKHIAAVFEKGVLRPEHPVDIPEGEHLQLIVVARKATSTNGNVAQALAEIAALPIEGNGDAFSNR